MTKLEQRVRSRPGPGYLALALSVGALSSCPSPARAPDGGTEAGVDASGPPAPVAFALPEPVLRRLTQSQYRNTLTDLFGATLVLPQSLEPDQVVSGSAAISASQTSISARGTEQYVNASYDIAQQVLRTAATRTPMLTCTPTGTDDPACAALFVRSVGRRLWRRPLADDEVTRITAVSSQAAMMLGDFYRGLEYGLAVVLSAPDFLFRSELGEADPANPGHARFTGYEFASRLSFLLWDSGPDDALLDAAASGGLDQAGALNAQVQRMLASPNARRGLRSFVTDWLGLAALDTLSKDPLVFPSFAPDVGPASREEVLRNTEWLVFDQDRDLRDMLTSRDTFVNRRLASLYAVQFPVRGAAVDTFSQVQLPPNGPRVGLLGTMAVLAGHSHPTSSSPTLRGRFIRETLLCATIPSPPVNVNTAIPEPSADTPTLRDRVQEHLAGASCRSCHLLFDPIGLGLEQFDGLGQFHTMENGAVVDPSSNLDNAPFADAAALAILLHDHPDLGRCIATRLYRYGQGRVETTGETPELGRVAQYFGWSGFKLRGLMLELATSPSFRQTVSVTLGGTP